MPDGEEKPLTPAERISLVQNDRVRRYSQIGIAIFLVGFGIGFLTWYVLNKADDAFLSYMAVGILALIFGGMGAAYAIFGLGRTVGSTNNSNDETIKEMLTTIKSQNEVLSAIQKRLG